MINICIYANIGNDICKKTSRYEGINSISFNLYSILSVLTVIAIAKNIWLELIGVWNVGWMVGWLEEETAGYGCCN